MTRLAPSNNVDDPERPPRISHIFTIQPLAGQWAGKPGLYRKESVHFVRVLCGAVVSASAITGGSFLLRKIEPRLGCLRLILGIL